ncbi:MAG: hypothetical protein QM755_10140 [Luteolibacter sp.]
MKPFVLTCLSSSLIMAGIASAQTPPPSSDSQPGSARVTVVALGTMPKSVVKWGNDGQVSYEMNQAQTLPPTGLYVKVMHEAKKEYVPFAMTLNIPSVPVPFGADGLVLYGPEAAKAEEQKKQPEAAMTIPTVKTSEYQMIMMWRKEPKDDWKHPEFLPLDLAESAFPPGSVYFINFTQRSVRLVMPQSNQARPMGFKSGFLITPAKDLPTFNYKVDCLGRNNEILPICFTGMKVDASSRNVVAVYEGAEGRPVAASFAVPVKPAPEKKTTDAPAPAVSVSTGGAH